MMLFVTAVNALGRFYRAGLEFTEDGRVLDVAEIGEAVVERLKAEANLHVREATDEEVDAHKSAAFGADDQSEHHDALMELIPNLPAEAFGQHGPKVNEVRDLLPEIDAKELTKDVIQAAFKALVEGGFEAPTANS